MRSTQALINKSNLKHNLQIVKKLAPNAEIMAIVKANGYGHGIVNAAKILEEAGVNYFGAAFPEEAVKLRDAGIKSNIVVLVPSNFDDTSVYAEYDLETVISDIDIMRAISEASAKADKVTNLHLFIDTGMNRDGLQPEAAKPLLEESRKLSNVQVTSACMHFATADDENSELARRQLAAFKNTVNNLMNSGYNFRYLHACNSAGLTNYPDAQFNMVRPGIFLYGYKSSGKINGDLGLKPVMKLKSNVLHVKHLGKGDTTGYGEKFIADRAMNIAVIPIGYGDGLNYLLTNQGECLIRGKRYRIVGSVCMDQTMVDIGYDDVKPGDEVVFIGEQADDRIVVEEIQEKTGSIPYEVLSMITERVPRLNVEDVDN